MQVGSQCAGLESQLEGTIDHLVSSVKMKDGIQLLSSTAGENMNQTSVTCSSQKKKKEKQKKEKEKTNDPEALLIFDLAAAPPAQSSSHKYFPLTPGPSSSLLLIFNNSRRLVDKSVRCHRLHWDARS